MHSGASPPPVRKPVTPVKEVIFEHSVVTFGAEKPVFGPPSTHNFIDKNKRSRYKSANGIRDS